MLMVEDQGDGSLVLTFPGGEWCPKKAELSSEDAYGIFDGLRGKTIKFDVVWQQRFFRLLHRKRSPSPSGEGIG